MANALLAAVRGGRLMQTRVVGLLGALRDLGITTEATAPEIVWGATLTLARDQGLSVRDAAYLELALGRDLPLATVAARLRNAAARPGITLY